MKNFFVALFVFILVTAGLTLFSAEYELTKVDIFSLKKNISGTDIKVMGIGVGDSIKDVLKKFNKTKNDLDKNEELVFLKVVPGFKLRIKDEKVEALLVSEDFKGKLIGATAKVFNKIDTEKNFKSYVIKYFLKPDKYESDSIAGYETNTIKYLNGINFTRFSSREGSSLVIMFKNIGI